MKQTAQEIAEYIGGELRGDATIALDSIASLKNAGPTDLSYAEEKFHTEVAQSRAGCVIVGSGEFPSKTVIAVRNPKLGFARAAERRVSQTIEETRMHRSANAGAIARLEAR